MSVLDQKNVSRFIKCFLCRSTWEKNENYSENLEQLLDPIVLAIWFMDDGGKAQNTPKGAYINATSFTYQERVQIQQSFQNVFNLQITIQKAGGNKQYNFYIPANSYTQFYTLVSPTVLLVPTMMYKLAQP